MYATKSGTRADGIKSGSNFIITLPSTGTWTVYAVEGSSSSNTSVTISKISRLYISLKIITYPLVGGRIFYDNGSNGATYTFYDENENVISDQSISSLTNAKYYSIKGTPTKDRWYVYDNSTRVDSYSGFNVTNGLLYHTGSSYGDIYWGCYGTSTGATTNTIGSGKTNTNLVLGMGVPSSYRPNIWGYINQMRTEKISGCDDWFIASETEQDKLRTSGLVDWYDKYIWSSVENDANNAYRWNSIREDWQSAFKNDKVGCFGMRAF